MSYRGAGRGNECSGKRQGLLLARLPDLSYPRFFFSSRTRFLSIVNADTAERQLRMYCLMQSMGLRCSKLSFRHLRPAKRSTRGSQHFLSEFITSSHAFLVNRVPCSHLYLWFHRSCQLHHTSREDGQHRPHPSLVILFTRKHTSTKIALLRHTL